jgi:peptide/nickel transport system substrate-binding protein
MAQHLVLYEKIGRIRSRVEFSGIVYPVIPDHGTMANALRAGEADWLSDPQFDLLPLLRADPALRVVSRGILGDLVFLRLNHRQPPFNNPAICRALLGAISQADCMTVVAGTDPTLSRVGVGFYPAGTPMASTAGLDVLTGPRDFERARRDLGAAGYAGERVVMMNYSPNPIADACGPVIADVMTRIGLNVERQAVDLGVWFQRISRDSPVDQGGWSCYCAVWSGIASPNPATHIFLRGNGSAQRPFMPVSPRLEGLRDAWLQAPDLATRQALAAEIQVQALTDVTAVPLGQDFPHTAYRASLEGVFPAFPHVFLNVRRRG